MNATRVRIVFTIWLAAWSWTHGCTLLADTDDAGPVDVRPRLSVPLQVHAGEPFVIEMSGSTIVGGEIRGYALSFDGEGTTQVREARTRHVFDTVGVHVVELALIGYEDVRARETVEALACGSPLACRPERPCPRGDVCDETGRCVAPSPGCAVDADCPDGLVCDTRRLCVAPTTADTDVCP